VPETPELTQIVLWDFQTGHSGNGLHAAAAAGVSWVIGHADGPPLALPIDIPEKWCGLVGANLTLSTLLDADLHGQATARRVDISAADTLRSFADQNSGNHAEIDSGWARNGSVAVEHGGIYPQGYFPCRDGHVGLVGRSRKDWGAIRDVIDRPDWTNEERFDDPFVLAENSKEADAKLAASLAQFDRDDLLKRAIHFGAPLAPVYAANELEDRDVVRKDFFKEDGSAHLPFEIVTRGS
jgi:crotonobetainyl-CoA:carnitine CoA-transferase CaiB-like acyl-CoA transferase